MLPWKHGRNKFICRVRDIAIEVILLQGHVFSPYKPLTRIILQNRVTQMNAQYLRDAIVPFHKDFSPSGEQIEHRKLAHEL